jgi:hypothetical protein
MCKVVTSSNVSLNVAVAGLYTIVAATAELDPNICNHTHRRKEMQYLEQRKQQL